MFKIFILVFIVITGWVVLSGRTHIQDPHANFRNAFAGSSHSSNDVRIRLSCALFCVLMSLICQYATATFKVLNAYAGWSNVNYVLNNVKNPVRTLKIAGPLGLGICAVLYLLANVSYFAAATKEEITSSGATVASLFFHNVFGTKAQKALTVFVALSALGNVITVTFAAARINQELAKEGIPLPFGNRFWASNWPTGKSPLPGLIIHLIPSIIVIIAPPPSVAYPFILDVEGYPQQIINFAIVVGLFWLRWTKPHVPRPFKVWWPLAVFFLAAAVFRASLPFPVSIPLADGGTLQCSSRPICHPRMGWATPRRCRTTCTASSASRSWPLAYSTGLHGASCQASSGTSSSRARRDSRTARLSLWYVPTSEEPSISS